MISWHCFINFVRDCILQTKKKNRNSLCDHSFFFYISALLRYARLNDGFTNYIQFYSFEKRHINEFFTLPNVFTCNFIKTETLAQVFSYEFCENFKNTYFYRTPVVAASGYFNHIWARQISTEFLFFCFIYSLENLLLILFSFFYLITTLLLDYFLLNSW